jgi:hypothetical protein
MMAASSINLHLFKASAVTETVYTGMSVPVIKTLKYFYIYCPLCAAPHLFASSPWDSPDLLTM